MTIPLPPPPVQRDFLLNGFTSPAWVIWFNQLWRAAAPDYSKLADAPDDTGAAAAGVRIGELYRTANTIKVRLV